MIQTTLLFFASQFVRNTISRGSVFFSLAMFFLLVSPSAEAGQMKRLVIEAEESIIEEFYENADLEIESISNYSLVNLGNDVGVGAEVLTRHPESGMISQWSCLVTFKKDQQGSFSAHAVDCTGTDEFP